MENIIVDEEATQIHSNTAAASLPLPEEMLPSSASPLSNNEGKRRRCSLAVTAMIFCLALVVLIVGLSVSLTGASSRSASLSSDAAGPASSPTTSTSTTTTTANTQPEPRKSTIQDVVSYLVTNKVSQSRHFSSLDTPQYRAAMWLADDDVRNLEVPFSHTLADGHPRAYTFIVRYVMAVNFFATGGDTDTDSSQWKSSLNWLSKHNVCGWNANVHIPGGHFVKAGVTCVGANGENDPDGNPTSLHLEYNRLKGTIPTENGVLTSLTVFSVHSNEGITGTIPTELCALAALTTLQISSNAVTGTLPSCLPTRLPNLTDLVVAKNRLTGSLPDGFADSSMLQKLVVEDNRLTGDPLAIFNAQTNLQEILADRNQFTGQLDDQFLLDHKDLTQLDLSSNNFTMSNGALPKHLFALRNLNILDLSHNQFDGHIPDDILSSTVVNTKLKYLSLHHNRLNGGLPTDMDRLAVLEHLDVSNNLFHGPLHKQLGNMTTLKLLFMSNNNFVAEGIPTELEGLTNLEELTLRNTRRTGRLPTWLKKLTNLQVLDLGSNQYSGTIPSNFDHLVQLKHLLLNNNTLHGTIPARLAALTNLESFVLDANQLEGTLNFICTDKPYQQLIYTDCPDTTPALTCNCCQCCSRDDSTINGGCSDPILALLDGSWEDQFQRTDYSAFGPL